MHRNIKLLLAASIIIHSGVNLFAPIMAIFIEQIGGGVEEAGIAVGIYAILQGIMYFVMDKVDESKFSKRWMMFTGYCVMAVGYFAYLYAAIPYHVFIIQGVIAIGEAIINPSWSAIIATSLEKGKERHIYSHFYGYRAFFVGLAAIAGGYVASLFGFDTVFIAMVILAIASGLLALGVKEES